MFALFRKLDRALPRFGTAAVLTVSTAAILLGLAPESFLLLLPVLLLAALGWFAIHPLRRWIGSCGRRPSRPQPPPTSGPPDVCPSCGYTLTGIPCREQPVRGLQLTRTVCPECGWAQW